MRAYVATTGALFALLVAAHAWRLVGEPQLSRDPVFLLFTAAPIALCIWSARLLLRRPRSPSG